MPFILNDQCLIENAFDDNNKSCVTSKTVCVFCIVYMNRCAIIVNINHLKRGMGGRSWLGHISTYV